MPTGEALTNEPKVSFRFNLSDMVSGSIYAFTASAEASGRDHGEQTMRQLLKYSGTVSGGWGTLLPATGPFGWPVILEVLERINSTSTTTASPSYPA